MKNIMDELKANISKGNVLFGIRQFKKNKENVKEIYVVSDARKVVVDFLRDNKNIEVKSLQDNKEETSKKLGISFFCEVFSVRGEGETPKVKKEKVKKLRTSKKE
jgi:hypothetical protein